MNRLKLNKMARVLCRGTLLILTVAFVAIAGGKQPATTQSSDQLQARWQAISIGQKAVPRGLQVFWTFGKDEITVTDNEGNEISRNKYSVDLTTKPPTFTRKVAGEKDDIGWIRFKENELQILLTTNTGKPPKSWDDGILLVFRPAPSSTQPASDR